MSDSIFHCSAEESLALLYVQNQQLAGKTPAELFSMYYSALVEIKQAATQLTAPQKRWL